MHKGYTINYFINFFSDLNSRNFVELATVEGGARDIVGHAAGVVANNTNVTLRNTTPRRIAALRAFLGNTATLNDINDGEFDVQLGLGNRDVGPRARVLAALRLRKKLGATAYRARLRNVNL